MERVSHTVLVLQSKAHRTERSRQLGGPAPAKTSALDSAPTAEHLMSDLLHRNTHRTGLIVVSSACGNEEKKKKHSYELKKTKAGQSAHGASQDEDPAFVNCARPSEAANATELHFGLSQCVQNLFASPFGFISVKKKGKKKVKVPCLPVYRKCC